MKRPILSLLILCIAIAFTVPSAFAASERTIEVSAQTELEVDPDVVDLRFTLEEKKKTPGLAVKALVALEKQALAALKKAGMPISDVQVSYISLNARFTYQRSSLSSGRRRVLDGYAASKTFVACVRNIDKMAHFVEALASANVTSFSTSFRSTKVPQHKKKLREMAVKAGQAKAAELAKHAGIKLGIVKFVREVPSGRGQYFSNSNSFAYTRASGQRGARPGAVKLRLSIRIAFMIQ